MRRRAWGWPRRRSGFRCDLSVIDTSFKEDPEARLVLANPQIVKMEGKQTGGEGCLSLPDFRENLARGKKVTIRAQDVNGNWYEKTGEDLLARAFQHEIDHLNGTLYIHHLSSLKRDMMRRKIKRSEAPGRVVGRLSRAYSTAAGTRASQYNQVVKLVYCGTPMFAVAPLEGWCAPVMRCRWW